MPDHLTAVDFARSSCTWLLKEQPSYGRFALDAVLTVTGPSDGIRETFFLGAQVFAGNVYGEGGLFRKPPYEFAVAFSSVHYRIFRASHGGGVERDSFGAVSEHFKALAIDIERLSCRRIDAVPSAILPSLRLVGRICVPVLAGRFGLELEFPVKHLNVDLERGAFQVETGPVLVLAPGAVGAPLHMLRRAYVNFNCADQAEFLIDADIGEGRGPVFRWSGARRDLCRIELFSCER